MDRYTKCLITLSLLSPMLVVHGQSYFQQQVDYEIHTSLDVENHVLRSVIDMIYTNASPDTLHELYFHLWPNAYSNQTTAFARQLIQHKNGIFQVAAKEDLGRIDSIDFAVDGEIANWKLDSQYPDIALLFLNEPLLPGTKIHIHTPFRVKIPASYSRLGHVGDAYQVTQWYPKPAVYDQNGWNPMPYLDQGEFYSEFGDFEVYITVPDNYLVASTGSLNTETERDHLRSLSGREKSSTSSSDSSGKKTLHFSSQGIHDFAWFADWRYQVITGEVILDSGKKIETWAYYTDEGNHLWENSLEYLHRALEFYSSAVGEYPYPQFTLAQASGSRGINMEYPMITVLGAAGDSARFDALIAHEVGHNWFYGVLASNERAHPWLDEGITSYYENRYNEIYYKIRQVDNNFLPFFKNRSPLSDVQLVLCDQSQRGTLQAPSLHSEKQSPGNYISGVYEKSALCFKMLESYLGKPRFDRAMNSYFTQWKFKHPQPDQFRQVFEGETGTDLGWFFEGLIGSKNMIDYAITHFDDSVSKLHIENQGSISAPLHCIGKYQGEKVFDFWLNGFDGRQVVDIPPGSFDSILIYLPEESLDVQYHNNALRVKKGTTSKPKLPLKFGFGGGYDFGKSTSVFILPVAGWNDYDKTMLGLTFYNRLYPAGPFQFMITPMYSFATSFMTGLYDMRYRKALSSGLVHDFILGVSGKSFHYDKDYHYEFTDKFIKTAPYLRLKFRKQSVLDHVRKSVEYRFVHIHQKYGQGINFEDFIYERKTRNYFVNVLEFKRDSDHFLYPNSTKFAIHQGKGFLKLNLDFDQKITYNNPKKALYLRFFGGWLPKFDNPDANVLLRSSGTPSFGFLAQDYLFDELLPGRNTQSGIFAHQIFAKDANLKTTGNVGISNEWMISFGVSTATPLPLPFQPYIDVAISPDPFESGINTIYSAGISLVLLKGMAEVYFPLLESKEITSSFAYDGRNSVFQRATFMLNLNKLRPLDMIDRYADRFFY